MRRPTFLGLFAVTSTLVVAGCAAGEPVADLDHEATAASPLTTIPIGATPPPIGLPFPLPVISVAPSWAQSCGGTGTARHFTVLTESCRTIATPSGSWIASPIYASGRETLCSMAWKGSSFPDYKALARIALPETAALPFGPQPLAIHAICDQSLCRPSSPTCVDRPRFPVTVVPAGGMGGCSSCGYVVDDEAYVVLPSEWVDDTIIVDVGDTVVYVDAPGVQSFRIDLEAVPRTSSPVGRFARIGHF